MAAARKMAETRAGVAKERMGHLMHEMTTHFDKLSGEVEHIKESIKKSRARHHEEVEHAKARGEALHKAVDSIAHHLEAASAKAKERAHKLRATMHDGAEAAKARAAHLMHSIGEGKAAAAAVAEKAAHHFDAMEKAMHGANEKIAELHRKLKRAHAAAVEREVAAGDFRHHTADQLKHLSEQEHAAAERSRKFRRDLLKGVAHIAEELAAAKAAMHAADAETEHKIASIDRGMAHVTAVVRKGFTMLQDSRTILSDLQTSMAAIKRSAAAHA